mgnify:CR=1 FL=1
MLQVSGLSVEVGGKLIVDDVSFTVMPKDKVGLVGRNGAGKTSLFKVLGGAAEPAGGSIVRKGGFGYLPQDPRIDGVPDTRTAVVHVLSGRQIDEQLERIELLRQAMEADPSDRNVSRYSRAQEQFADQGGYAAESEARSIMAGLGLPPDRMELPIGVLSGGERRRVELSRILFAGSDLLLLVTVRLCNPAHDDATESIGGDRGAIQQANLAQQQGLAASQTLGNLYNQAYQQALAAADHLQQTLAGGEVVDVVLQMAAQLADALAQHRHLNFHGTGVGAMGLMGVDQFLLLDGVERHARRLALTVQTTNLPPRRHPHGDPEAQAASARDSQRRHSRSQPSPSCRSGGSCAATARSAGRW